MVHGKNRIPYWIDRRLNGLAGPEYDATISFGLPIEPEDSQYGKYRSKGMSPSERDEIVALVTRLQEQNAELMAANEELRRQFVESHRSGRRLRSRRASAAASPSVLAASLVWACSATASHQRTKRSPGRLQRYRCRRTHAPDVEAGVKGGAKMYRSSEVGEERRRLQTVPPTALHRVARNSMEGVKDVQSGYVRAGPQSMYGRGHEHPGGCSGVRTASRYGTQDAGVFSASRIPSGASSAASEAGAVYRGDRPDTGVKGGAKMYRSSEVGEEKRRLQIRTTQFTFSQLDDGWQFVGVDPAERRPIYRSWVLFESGVGRDIARLLSLSR